MFAKRLAAERSESPETSIHPDSRRGSTVADTDGKRPEGFQVPRAELTRFIEPRSSPAPSRGRRGKPTRGSTRGTRSTRLQVEVERPSSASVATEDEQMEDADVDDEDGEDEGDSDAGDADDNDAEEADAEAASSPATRSTRTQTAKSKKDKKGAAASSTTTRRTGRRR